MNTPEILALFDQEQRREITYPNVKREVFPHLIRLIDDNSKRGVIIYSRLTEEVIDRVIKGQIDHFGEMGYGLEWKVFDHDPLADQLKTHLQAHDFQWEESEALMLLDINHPPDILRQVPPHDIRELTDPDQVAWVQAIEEQVWEENFDDLAARLRREITETPDRIKIYVAFVDDQPVSAAWIDFSSPNFAGLWGGSTLAAYRGKGIYTALVAVRLQAALQRGVRFLYVDASSMSRPILEKLGFNFFGFSYPCEWTPETER